MPSNPYRQFRNRRVVQNVQTFMLLDSMVDTLGTGVYSPAFRGGREVPLETQTAKVSSLRQPRLTGAAL